MLSAFHGQITTSSRDRRYERSHSGWMSLCQDILTSAISNLSGIRNRPRVSRWRIAILSQGWLCPCLMSTKSILNDCAEPNYSLNQMSLLPSHESHFISFSHVAVVPFLACFDVYLRKSCKTQTRNNLIFVLLGPDKILLHLNILYCRIEAEICSVWETLKSLLRRVVFSTAFQRLLWSSKIRTLEINLVPQYITDRRILLASSQSCGCHWSA